MRRVGRILRGVCLVGCTALVLAIVGLLVAVAFSRLPIFFMRQWVFEDAVVEVVLVDHLLEVEVLSSWPDREDLLRYAADEQRYIDGMHERLHRLRKEKNISRDELAPIIAIHKAAPFRRFCILAPSNITFWDYDGVHHMVPQNVPIVLSRLRFPLWVPAIVLSVYPIVVFLRGPVRRYRLRRRGLCLHCGYNLTGNVSGICSECGAPV